jgi:sodium/potassium/calcium exchanger 6
MRPGLISAIEFRDVVNSLRADSGARTLAVFGGLDAHTPHIHGTIHTGGHHRRSRASSVGRMGPLRPQDHVNLHRRHVSAVERPKDYGDFESAQPDAQRLMPRSAGWTEGVVVHNPFDEPFGTAWRENAVSTGETPTPSSESLIDLSEGVVEDPWRNATPTQKRGSGGGDNAPAPTAQRPERLTVDTANLIPVSPSPSTPESINPGGPSTHNAPSAPPPPPVPSIVVTTETGQINRPIPSSPTKWWYSPRRSIPPRVRWFVDTLVTVTASLFPTVQNFRSRSLLGKIAGIVAVPPIVALNLTLPVLDDEADVECLDVEEKAAELRDAFDGGESEEEEEEEDMDKDTNEEEEAEEERRDERLRRKRGELIARELHRPAAAHNPRSPSNPRLDVSAVDRALEEGGGVPEFHLDGATQVEGDASGGGGGGGGEDVDEEAPGSPPPTPVVGISDAQLTRVLNGVQCTLAPPFCVLALLGSSLPPSPLPPLCPPPLMRGTLRKGTN